MEGPARPSRGARRALRRDAALRIPGHAGYAAGARTAHRRRSGSGRGGAAAAGVARRRPLQCGAERAGGGLPARRRIPEAVSRGGSGRGRAADPGGLAAGLVSAEAESGARPGRPAAGRGADRPRAGRHARLRRARQIRRGLGAVRCRFRFGRRGRDRPHLLRPAVPVRPGRIPDRAAHRQSVRDEGGRANLGGHAAEDPLERRPPVHGGRRALLLERLHAGGIARRRPRLQAFHGRRQARDA